MCSDRWSVTSLMVNVNSMFLFCMDWVAVERVKSRSNLSTRANLVQNPVGVFTFLYLNQNIITLLIPIADLVFLKRYSSTQALTLHWPQTFQISQLLKALARRLEMAFV